MMNSSIPETTIIRHDHVNSVAYYLILTAFATTRGEQDVEIVLAITAAVELVEDAVGERLEALATRKARAVKELAV